MAVLAILLCLVQGLAGSLPRPPPAWAGDPFSDPAAICHVPAADGAPAAPAQPPPAHDCALCPSCLGLTAPPALPVVATMLPVRLPCWFRLAGLPPPAQAPPAPRLPVPPPRGPPVSL
ncbi:conserved protein of unknown function [Rhodovastum atsumiense]|nr:conserved protein of unknown function [Rhodovastum atsumiense]